jgi:AcrR family transcriptional regulator
MSPHPDVSEERKS